MRLLQAVTVDAMLLDVAFPWSPQTLTDYEKQRLEQMAKVKAKMDELKLKETGK